MKIDFDNVSNRKLYSGFLAVTSMTLIFHSIGNILVFLFFLLQRNIVIMEQICGETSYFNVFYNIWKE